MIGTELTLSINQVVVYDYSGGGYVAAEHLLELVTGESFTDWVTENLLDVLSLKTQL